ncbi:hypothetical protein GC170_09605 [bacterium]|nr:hypothetical protein [bacterium]
MYQSTCSRLTARIPLVLRGVLLGSLFFLNQCHAEADGKPDPKSEAANAFERMKSLKGEWVDNSGTFGAKDQVAVVYEVIGNGSAVMERLFRGQPHEMVSIYHMDGDQLVMTHYCAARNQPKMKAGRISDTRIDFDFAGGTNFDPAKDAHMHNGYIEWTDKDHVHGKWYGWAGGKASDHAVSFELARKKPSGS